jgi:hypothetical protein
MSRSNSDFPGVGCRDGTGLPEFWQPEKTLSEIPGRNHVSHFAAFDYSGLSVSLGLCFFEPFFR